MGGKQAFLPLPDNYDPEGIKCIKLEVPSDPIWQGIFWGYLEGLARWYTWQRDEGHHGAVMAEKYRLIIDDARAHMHEGDCMECCPPEPKLIPKQWRVQSGVTQYSDDGVTWYEFPDGQAAEFGQRDPSFPVGADKPCIAAKNIVSALRTQFQTLHDALAVSAVVVSIMALITAAVLVFVTAGAAAPLALALASEVIAIGAVGIENNLTPSFWDNVECIIYTNIGSDGLFSNSEFAAFHSAVLALGDGGTILTFLVDIYGPVGLNNMVTSAGITTCNPTPCSSPSPYTEMDFTVKQSPALFSTVWQAAINSTDSQRIYRYGTIPGKWIGGRGLTVDICNNGFSGWTTRVDIRIPLSSGVVIKRIQVDFSVQLDTSLGTGQMLGLHLYDAAGNSFFNFGKQKSDFTTPVITMEFVYGTPATTGTGWNIELWVLSEVANTGQYHPAFGKVDIKKMRLYAS